MTRKMKKKKKNTHVNEINRFGAGISPLVLISNSNQMATLVFAK